MSVEMHPETRDLIAALDPLIILFGLIGCKSNQRFLLFQESKSGSAGNSERDYRTMLAM